MLDGFNDSVMIAFLPVVSDWSKLELPHMTLVYAGEVKDRKPGDFNEMAKATCAISLMTRPFTLNVLGKSVFGGGEDEKVDVFQLRKTPELLAMREFVEKWNKSEFPFNPHVTIGPEGTFIENEPRFIAFDKITIGWGDDYLTFRL